MQANKPRLTTPKYPLLPPQPIKPHRRPRESEFDLEGYVRPPPKAVLNQSWVDLLHSDQSFFI